MKYFFLTALFCLSSLLGFSQNLSEEYSRVKIDLTTTPIIEIAKLGLEADHGIYAKGKHLINDFSKREIQLLEQNNIRFEILIEDVKAHYKSQNEIGHNHSHEVQQRTFGNCDDDPTAVQYDYDTPVNYQDGTMGGYLTYDELLATLDQMVAMYPNLISPKTQIGNITTHEGRPIYWLRLSDNPNQEEAEPELLYTALHHAREPNSLSQMVFYMWYLLENYDTDDEVKYLVDNTEMYFIPCINPDGYIYNETIDPNGGGLWRKNRYVDNGTVYGVDLNRNYGYEWGYNNSGSSPNQTSDTYRGTSAFSEPETQAVRDFCNEHQFKITLNYHAYGNLLIYPWGYSDQVSADNNTFTSIASAINQENNFFAGTGTQTVGYTVNGNSDDWMYGEVDSKPAIFSLTPEVGDGNYGFWPPADEIDRLNKSCLLQNLTAAHLLHNYAEAEELNSENIIANKEGTLELSVKKYGLLSGDITLSVVGLGNATVLPNNSVNWTMDHLDVETNSFDFVISDDVENNETIQFSIEVDNGDMIFHDTISKVYLEGNFMDVLTDNGGNLNEWFVDGFWDTTDEDFVSSPSSYTDSPGFDYFANSETSMTLVETVDLTEATNAFLNFYAKWDIEPGYDYAQVMVATDGQNFSPLCGKYTTTGNNFQDNGEPLYDGTQDEWVLEEIDLNDYLGETILIKFRMVSDGGVEEDGFYFDDLSVSVIEEIPSSVENNDLKKTEWQVFPNPFSESFNVSLNLTQKVKSLQLVLVNSLGQVVLEKSNKNLRSGNHRLEFENESMTTGVYFLQLLIDGEKIGSQKVVKLK